MSPEKFALGLMVMSIGISLFGNLSASFLWWFYTTGKEERKRAWPRLRIVGVFSLVLFGVFFIGGFIIFLSAV
ncbi:MAG: hypothetical protein JW878_09510 [Methanomicrobia archaeon]|nr:hypothetical protein [Methanomicrobia archaeon]